MANNAFFLQIERLLDGRHHDKALQLLEENESTYRENKDWENFIRTLAYHGKIYGLQNESQQALKVLDEALTISQHHLPANSLNLAFVYECFGDVYLTVMLKHNEALAHYQQSLKIIAKRNTNTDPALANAYNNVGIAYKSLGEFEKAEDFHKRALAIVEGLEEAHPKLHHNTLSYLGDLYYKILEDDLALQYLNQALQVWQEGHLPEHHQNLAATYVSLGFTYSNQGNYDKAIAFEQKAAALRNAKLKYLESADANTADPFYWASFILIGNNEPLIPSKASLPSYLLPVLCGIIFLALGSGLLWKKVKS